MAIDYGFNFRATAGFVTDVGTETYCLAADIYTSTIRGTPARQFGWGGGFVMTDVNRNASVDRRLAGINYYPNLTSGNGMDWRVFLDAPGDFDVYLAAGDADPFAHPQYIRFYDDTTLIATVINGASSPASGWIDAMGTAHTSAANWIANQLPRRITLATTTFIVRIGATTNATDVSTISHLRIVTVGAAPSSIPVIMHHRRMQHMS